MDEQELIQQLRALYQLLEQKYSRVDSEWQTDNIPDQEPPTTTQIEEPKKLQKTGIFVLPSTLIREILLFMNYRYDIPIVLTTWKKLYRIGNSQKFCIRVNTLPVRSRSRLNSDESEQIFGRPIEEEASVTLEDIREKNKTSSAVIDYLAVKLVQQEKLLAKEKKQNTDFQNEIRVTQTFNSKSTKRLQEVKEQYKTENELNTQLRFGIAQTKEYFTKEVTAIKKDLAEREDESSKLKTQKTVLRNEVRKRRKELEDSQLEMGEFRDALSKMKQYFDVMFKPKVESIIRSFN